MVCRYDSDDPRKCERCGEFLWVLDDGMFCGECGVTMPCTMQVRPVPESLSRALAGSGPKF
jgi:hypothetical protein